MSDIALLYSLFEKHPFVSTDTRKITKGCLFFALKGPNFNGNAFAEQALAQGASFVVIDEPEFLVDDRCLLVDDVLSRLQQLATYHREQLKIPVIAIVGSNGKTTTKELLTSVLSQKFNVLATPGNFNNHIGLPLTLLQLNQTHQIAVIEMGANHIGENAALCSIAKPTHGIVTNNGKDHLEGFGSMEGVATSNSELYYYLLHNNGLAFVNANDEWLMRMAARLVTKITYAANDEKKNADADVTGIANALRPEIKFTCNNSTIEITSSLSGDYNFDNIMAAVSIGKHFGLNEEEIKAGIESYHPSNNRSQVINKTKNTIYLDAYNANPSSMEASIRNFAALPYEGKIAIVGDMFEMGSYAAAEHKSMIAICHSLALEQVIFVGEEFKKQATKDDIVFATTDEAIVFIKNCNYSGKQIFLKGSRGMKLELIAEAIS